MSAAYVIGGGALGLEVLRAARAVGLELVVTDRDPAAPGLALADERWVADGADVEAHLAFAREVARRRRIALVHCGAEFAARTVQRLSAELGLDANPADAVERVLDKGAMKRAFQAAGVPTPPSELVRSPAELRALVLREEGEVVIKPAGGSGSRGVRVVGPRSDLGTAFRASLAAVEGERRLVVEPFERGRCIDANGWLVDGRYLACGTLEKFVGPPPECLPLGGYDPARLTASQRATVHGLLERACAAVGLRAGPVKGDFLLTERGWLVLEVAPRFHGDVTTSNTLPYGSGIHPVRALLRRAATGVLDARDLVPDRTAHATWRVICLPPGRVLHLPDPRPGDPRVTAVWHNPRVRDEVPRYGDTTRIPGYACAFGADARVAEEALAGWFAGAGYRVRADPAHAAWYRALGRRLDEIGFERAACGWNEPRGDRSAA